MHPFKWFWKIFSYEKETKHNKARGPFPGDLPWGARLFIGRSVLVTQSRSGWVGWLSGYASLEACEAPGRSSTQRSWRPWVCTAGLGVWLVGCRQTFEIRKLVPFSQEVGIWHNPSTSCCGVTLIPILFDFCYCFNFWLLLCFNLWNTYLLDCRAGVFIWMNESVN